MQNAARNVTPVRAAVTSACGSATLRVAPSSHAGLNSLGSAFPYAGVEAERMESVETITLDAFAERHSIDRVAVIKLDVEGAEGAMLQGSRRLLEDHRPAIIAEIMARSLVANGTTVESLESLLRDAGYRLFVVNDSTATRTSCDTRRNRRAEHHRAAVAALLSRIAIPECECRDGVRCYRGRRIHCARNDANSHRGVSRLYIPSTRISTGETAIWF